MLFQDAITDARAELGDTYEGNYSYPAADMRRYAVDGVREAWKIRPAQRFDETLVMYPDSVLPASEADIALPIPLSDEMQVAITYYIIFRCLSRDITDAGNAAAAAAWKARFDQTIAG